MPDARGARACAVAVHNAADATRASQTRRWTPARVPSALMLGMGVVALLLPATAMAQAVSPQPRQGAVAAARDTTAPAATPPLLQSVVLLGATPLPSSQVQAQVAVLLGRPADAALLAELRRLVAAAHDAAGLGLVAIDAPVLQADVALVRINPLRVRNLDVRTVQGTPGAQPQPAPALQADTQTTLPALQTGQTPDLKALDRQLRLANLQAHRRWAVDFRPPEDGGTAPSTAHHIDARVTLNDTGPLYGRVMLDNAGQEATGRERLRAQIGHSDLLGPGRSLDLTALVSLPHPDRQQQLALRYQHPVPAWGTLFAAEVSRARSKPGLVGGFFDVSGNSRSVNLSARHLLARQGALEPYVEVALESAVHEDVVDFFGVNLGSKVGVAPLALAAGATWTGGAWSAFGQARVRHNSGWGSSSGATDYAGARFGATPHWSAVDVLAETRRAMGGGNEAVLRVQAQWSDDALVSPQQFRAGGPSLMRGLREGELAGDKGTAVALEYWWAVAATHRVGALLDVAEARRNQPLPGEPASSRAASVGVAWHWNIHPGLRLQATAAHLVSARNLPQSQRGDSRLHVLLDWTF